jgi:hypothetical protein
LANSKRKGRRRRSRRRRKEEPHHDGGLGPKGVGAGGQVERIQRVHRAVGRHGQVARLGHRAYELQVHGVVAQANYEPGDHISGSRVSAVKIRVATKFNLCSPTTAHTPRTSSLVTVSLSMRLNTAYLCIGCQIGYMDHTCWYFSPRYLALKTPVDDSQYGPRNQSPTPESEQPRLGVGWKTTIDGSRYFSCNPPDTRV